jgi:hypothetical protein
MILAAAAIDFIDHLKKHSDGWVFEPLVMVDDTPLKHMGFVTIITKPNNRTSPYEFYLSKYPKGVSTLIKATKSGRLPRIYYPRLIEMRLKVGPTAKIELLYWRANGWKQNQIPHGRFYSHKSVPVQQPNESNFRVYAMERVTKTKRKSYIHRDVLDISAIDSADRVAKLTMTTLEKSLEGVFGREELADHTEHLAVMLDGHNFHYDRNWFCAEVIYATINR